MKRDGIILAFVFAFVLVGTFGFVFASEGPPPAIGYGMCCNYHPPGCSAGKGVYDWFGEFVRCTCAPNEPLASITECDLVCPICY